jgi:hypothetical protein
VCDRVKSDRGGYPHEQTKGGTNRYWSKEARLAIVKKILAGEGSAEQTAGEMNISSGMIASMAGKYHLPVIPVGSAVQKIRKIKEFDYANGGLSLNRDGFHLTLDYGRYLAGLVWFSFFTGRKAAEVSFAPEGVDFALITVLKNNL